MGTDTTHNLKDTKAKLDYLKELLTDRNILANDPRTYLHVGKILEKEILRIRSALFATYGINPISDSELPEPEGPKVNLQSKVYMPTDSCNSFNFVGRILGPDGSTAKCLQQCLGVKIMVRGRGSMRDRKKEEANIGKPNWEHLNDRLHVVLTVEDYENRAKARLAKASEYITLFLKESMKGSDKDDKVKQMQLMELSFRRAPCHSWRFNGNNLLDMGFTQKSGALFQNGTAANFVNFGYAYPPSGPLFSPLHHTTLNAGAVNPLGPYGQQQQQPPQQHQQPYHQPAGTNQQGGPQAMGTQAYPHPYNNSLNPAAFLLGHSPSSATGYASPYSPNSHAQQSAPASGLAVAPMSYWTGQGVPHLSAEYAFTPAATPFTCKQMTSANEAVSSASTLTNPSESQPSQNGQTIDPNVSEDLMQQRVLTEFSSCKIDDIGALDFTSTNNTNALRPYSDASELQARAHYSSTNGSILVDEGVSGMRTSTNTCATSSGSTNGSMAKQLTGSKRYSQRPYCQLSDRGRQSHSIPGSVASTSVRGQGRTAMVTVRIGSSLDQHSDGFKSPELRDSASMTGLRPSADEDWPELNPTTDRDKGEANQGTSSFPDEENSEVSSTERSGCGRKPNKPRE